MKLTSLFFKNRYYNSLLKLHVKSFEKLRSEDPRLMEFEALTSPTLNDSYTALHLGAQAGQADTVEHLLAGLRERNKIKRCINARSETGATPLLLASQMMHAFANIKWVTDYPGVINLLLRAGADPNIPEHIFSFTALHNAAYFDAGIVDNLLSHGADPTAKDQEGNTPLHLAVTRNTSQSNAASKLLLNFMQQNHLDLNSKNIAGYTAYELAEITKNLPILSQFRRGANLNHGKAPSFRCY